MKIVDKMPSKMYLEDWEVEGWAVITEAMATYSSSVYETCNLGFDTL